MALLISLTACATLTFKQQLANGYATIATISDTTAILYKAGKISKDDASSVLATNVAAKASLDALRSTPTTSDAVARLQQVTAVLTATQQYLAAKGAVN